MSEKKLDEQESATAPLMIRIAFPKAKYGAIIAIIIIVIGNLIYYKDLLISFIK